MGNFHLLVSTTLLSSIYVFLDSFSQYINFLSSSGVLPILLLVPVPTTDKIPEEHSTKDWADQSETRLKERSRTSLLWTQWWPEDMIERQYLFYFTSFALFLSLSPLAAPNDPSQHQISVTGPEADMHHCQHLPEVIFLSLSVLSEFAPKFLVLKSHIHPTNVYWITALCLISLFFFFFN